MVKIVDYNNTKYAVFNVTSKKKSIPVIVDKQDYAYVTKLNKKWNINDTGFIYCKHTINGNSKDIYLHEIIMALKNNTSNTKSIIHINRLGIDNRRENLIYDSTNKETNKNIVKKQRIIKLPKSSGIKSDELPTFVWYLKPDKTHGDRFMIQVGDVSWKSTSSSEFSLRYKLEEAKKFLRDLKVKRTDLFDKYSMNGEFNKDGKQLLDSFYTILQNAGYKNVKKIDMSYTDIYLKPNTKDLTESEVDILND